LLLETKRNLMVHDTRIRQLTDTDVAVDLLLPIPLLSGFLYAFLLTATLSLSVLSVVFFL
jgi:hypothetical protein